MTADNFTEAAREEFYRVWHSPIHDHSQIGMAIHMAEWARDHLAAQEPTTAEVEAFQDCLYERTLTWVPGVEVRAAMSAARAARRGGEAR